MSWSDERILAVDVETTGVDVEEARIVFIAVALVGGGIATNVLSLIVDPGVEIPEDAAAIHGVTTERARAEGVEPAQALGVVLVPLIVQAEAGGAVVAFNARFDLTVCDREFRRHGVAGVEVLSALLVVDPFVIDRHLDRFRRGSRRLSAQCEHYGAVLDGAHEAESDAVAAARLAWRIAKSGQVIRRKRNRAEAVEAALLAREWEEVRHDLPALHRAQARWAADQSGATGREGDEMLVYLSEPTLGRHESVVPRSQRGVRVGAGRDARIGYSRRGGGSDACPLPIGIQGAQCRAEGGLMGRSGVSLEYARAYEAGALAALDWLAENYPDMAEPSDDYPAPTMAAAEHIGGVIDLMLGRSDA